MFKTPPNKKKTDEKLDLVSSKTRSKSSESYQRSNLINKTNYQQSKRAGIIKSPGSEPDLLNAQSSKHKTRDFDIILKDIRFDIPNKDITLEQNLNTTFDLNEPTADAQSTNSNNENTGESISTTENINQTDNLNSANQFDSNPQEPSQSNSAQHSSNETISDQQIPNQNNQNPNQQPLNQGNQNLPPPNNSNQGGQPPNPPQNNQNQGENQNFELNMTLTLSDIIRFNIPFYKGEPKELNGFINSCDMYASLTPDALKPNLYAIIKAKITGEALAKLQPLSDYANWQELKQAMKTKIKKPVSYEYAHQNLITMFQKPNESIETFGDKVRKGLAKLNEATRLFSEVPNDQNAYRKSNERLAISRFTQNIRDINLRTLVEAASKQTLEDTIVFAMEKELTNKNSNIKKCTICNRNNHTEDECRQKNNTNTTTSSNANRYNNRNTNQRNSNNYQNRPYNNNSSRNTYQNKSEPNGNNSNNNNNQNRNQMNNNNRYGNNNNNNNRYESNKQGNQSNNNYGNNNKNSSYTRNNSNEKNNDSNGTNKNIRPLNTELNSSTEELNTLMEELNLNEEKN